MFCVKCGKELADGEKFCPACGTKQGGDGISLSALKDQGKKMVSDAASFAQEKGSSFVSYAQSVDKESLLKGKKPIFLGLGVLFFMILLSVGIVKCVHGSDSYRQKKAIAAVKNGFLVEYDPSTTIGERVDNFMDDPVWSAVAAKNGIVYVVLDGTVYKGNKLVKIKMVFDVFDDDGKYDTFMVDYFKVNGEDSDEDEFLEALYKD